MTDNTEIDATALLIESEARFREALGRLAKALVGTKDLKSQIERLSAEKNVLEGGLNNLKSDYERLEKSVEGMKDKMGQGSSTGTGEDAEDVKALQKELGVMRADYDAMEQSYSLLKTQFLDTQQKETASDKRSVRQLRAGLSEQLDGTIGRLEEMLSAADAR